MERASVHVRVRRRCSHFDFLLDGVCFQCARSKKERKMIGSILLDFAGVLAELGSTPVIRDVANQTDSTEICLH